MPSIYTDTGEIITEFRLATVEYKTALTDEVWIPIPFLFVNKLTRAVNAYDEAELVRFLGDMVQPGDTSFNEWQPVDLVGNYVRVTIPQEELLEDIVWVGYVVGDATQRSSVKGALPADHKLTGKEQILTAVGLEYFLDRTQIESAYIYGSPDPTQIQRVIPFNGGQGVALDADTRTRANRSAATNADGVYTFVPPDETGALWTLGNVVYYLMQYFTTKNSAGNPLPTTYELDPVDVLAATLDGIAPTFNPEGMTPFQVLNRLVSPQRGFVWWLEYSEAIAPKCTIRVETLATSAITLPSLGTIPANRDQQSLDFDEQRDVDDVIVAKVGSRHYHQVICRGARMTSTCTLGNVDDGSIDELVSDWDAGIESEYWDAASGTDGYADLTDDEKAQRDDAFRQSERLSRVYSYFRLSKDWDGKSADGTETDRTWTLPVLDADGTPAEDQGQPASVNGVRLLNHTRLKRGWNYADTADIEDTTPAGTEADYMPMFAIMQVAEPDLEASPIIPEKYQKVEAMGHADFAAGALVSATINISYSLHSQPNTPGIILNAHGVPHACALNHFADASTATDPQVDYETLRVTCTMEADSYCESRYPLDAALPASTPLQKLILYVGDEYRIDYLTPNTVVDLINGEPVTTNGGVLRDDRKRLQDIARVAYEWYQLDRQPITVKFKAIRNLWRLGMLITAIGSGTTQETVNTVVSVVTYDCAKGHTTIQTHDTALDLAKLA